MEKEIEADNAEEIETNVDQKTCIFCNVTLPSKKFGPTPLNEQACPECSKVTYIAFQIEDSMFGGIDDYRRLTMKIRALQVEGFKIDKDRILDEALDIINENIRSSRTTGRKQSSKLLLHDRIPYQTRTDTKPLPRWKRAFSLLEDVTDSKPLTTWERPSKITRQ
jgi:hypothetical protein